jgi:hypothetical protein
MARRAFRRAGIIVIACSVAISAHLCHPQLLSSQSLTQFSAPPPSGATRIPFENLEGLVLFTATMTGKAADTTGLLIFDSGAGYLALDQPVAYRLGLVGEPGPAPGVALAERPLARLGLGALEIDYVTPLLTIDGRIVRRVTDRPVLGLLGQRPLTGRAVIVDYRDALMTVIPVPQQRERSVAASRRSLAPHLSSQAVPVPFTLVGDGKILVKARVANPHADSMSSPLTWIVDTGATRCVLFEESIRTELERHRSWRAMEGLRAPTLFGDEEGRIASVPLIAIEIPGGTIREENVETVMIGGPLAGALSSVVGQKIHGLIGYTLLSRYRLGIDYVNETLWLDPMPEGWEGRPHRDSQIGIQIERRSGALVIAGVVRGSPAAESGMRIGDEIVALAGTPSRALDIALSMRRLEGPPGSSVTLTTRRDGQLQTHKLLRRRLL